MVFIKLKCVFNPLTLPSKYMLKFSNIFSMGTHTHTHMYSELASKWLLTEFGNHDRGNFCPWDHLCIICKFRQHHFFPAMILYASPECTVSRVPVLLLRPSMNDLTWHNRGSLQCGYLMTMIKTVSMKNANVFTSQMSNETRCRLYIYQTPVEPWRIWWFGVFVKGGGKSCLRHLFQMHSTDKESSFFCLSKASSNLKSSLTYNHVLANSGAKPIWSNVMEVC